MAMSEEDAYKKSMRHLRNIMHAYPHIVHVRPDLRGDLGQPEAVKWTQDEFGPPLAVGELTESAASSPRSWTSIAQIFFFRDHASALAFKLRWG
jgi:hypothetical protein